MIATFICYHVHMGSVKKQKRQFIEYLEVERDRSPKTVENYDRCLTRFFYFGKIKKASDITEGAVAKFKTHLSQQPGSKANGKKAVMKKRTLNHYLIAIRAFLKYLNQNDIPSLLPRRILLEKISEESFDVISPEDMKRLIAAPDTKTLEGKRDKAILELFLSTGLRISELCSLSVHDIDVGAEEFSLRGINGDERILFVSDALRIALIDYLDSRKDAEEVLFVRYGRKQNDGGDSRISPRAVQRLINKYATAVGITCKVTPQIIRHSFAANVIQSGADLRTLQAQLGHLDINTTQAYLKNKK